MQTLFLYGCVLLTFVVMLWVVLYLHTADVVRHICKDTVTEYHGINATLIRYVFDWRYRDAHWLTRLKLTYLLVWWHGALIGTSASGYSYRVVTPDLNPLGSFMFPGYQFIGVLSTHACSGYWLFCKEKPVVIPTTLRVPPRRG